MIRRLLQQMRLIEEITLADGIGDINRIATTAPPDMFMAAGTGKQRLYIVPSFNIVVARMAPLTSNDWSDHEFMQILLDW